MIAYSLCGCVVEGFRGFFWERGTQIPLLIENKIVSVVIVSRSVPSVGDSSFLFARIYM